MSFLSRDSLRRLLIMMATAFISALIFPVAVPFPPPLLLLPVCVCFPLGTLLSFPSYIQITLLVSLFISQFITSNTSSLPLFFQQLTA